MTIFCVFTSLPLMRRKMYTPAVIPHKIAKIYANYSLSIDYLINEKHIFKLTKVQNK